MLNRIVLMGRFTADPELKYTTNTQTPVTSFVLAVDRDYSVKGDNEKKTDFIACSAWRGSAEFICKYFRRGSLCAVVGRLESRQWQDKDGNNRTTWDVQVESIYFAGPKSDAIPAKAPVDVKVSDGDGMDKLDALAEYENVSFIESSPHFSDFKDAETDLPF